MNKNPLSNTSFSRSIKPLVAAALVVITTNAAAQGKGETVRLQDFPGTIGLTMQVAVAKGYCKSAGINCELKVIPSASLGVQAVLAKSLEGAFVGSENVVPAMKTGAKLKWVANIYTKSVGVAVAGNHAITPNADKPFPEWIQDMKGKKIGVTARGSGSETGMRFILKKGGINPEDVTVVAVGGPNTMTSALANKQVDFAFSYQPAADLCEVTKACKVIWRGDADPEPAEMFANNGAGAGLVMSQAYIDANPNVVAALVNAFRNANKFINDPRNFEEVVKISESYFKFDGPSGNQLTRTLLKRQISIGAHDVHIDRNAVKAGVDYMVLSGQWDKAVDVNEFIDSRAP